MVSSGQVNGDWSSLQSILEKYQSEIDGLDSTWKGPSHDGLMQKAQDFVSEYEGAIGAQMNAYATACDLYEQYKVAKQNLEISKNNYSTAVSNNDSTNASKYNSQINSYTNECNNLKTQIESNLKKASSQRLTATSSNASSIEASATASTNAGETDTATTGMETDISMGGGSVSMGSYSGGSSYSYSGGSYSGGSSSSSYSSTSSGGGTIAPSTGSVTSIDYGTLDMNNYPTGSSKADGIARAVLVAKYLIENGGFTKEQAAAMVGVYVDENNCDPGSYMAAEKNGQGVSGTGGSGYGAGIGSWTFTNFKNQCLNDAGYPAGTPIESLSLQQQCDMIIAMSQKSCKTYYDALKRCDNIEDAAATAFIITGGVGSSSNWSTHPTPAEAKALSDKYGRSNDDKFGYSSYHWNSDQRRLALAKEIVQHL